MGLTEQHWFEDEEPELTERQLEEYINDLEKAYKKGYTAGYKDGSKKAMADFIRLCKEGEADGRQSS